MQIRCRFIEIGKNLCRHFQGEDIVKAFPGRSVQSFQYFGNIVCMVIVEFIPDYVCRFSAADDGADVFFKISIVLCGCGDRRRFRGAYFLFVHFWSLIHIWFPRFLSFYLMSFGTYRASSAGIKKSTASRERDEMLQMAVSNPRQGDGQIYMKTNRAGKRPALNLQSVKADGNVLPDSPIHTQKDPATDQQSGTHGWNS